MMDARSAVQIVSRDRFDATMAQTSGSQRFAAIGPLLGISSSLCGGLFEVQPSARTEIHDHSEQDAASFGSALFEACQALR
jgi:uncharacterized RmlC-like cupin family protein